MPFHLCWGHLCVSGYLCVQTKASVVRSFLQLYLSLNFLFVQGLKVTQRWKIGALLDIFWTNSQPCICMWVSCSPGIYQSFQSSSWNLSLQLFFLYVWPVSWSQTVGHDWVTSLHSLHSLHTLSLEKEMATHASILAWRIPWTEGLAGHGPWGRRESDTTEVTEHACTHCDILA